MATAFQNLSGYNPDSLPAAEILANQKYAIVVADWNAQITHTLMQGAVRCFVESGVQLQNISVIHVPGAFELTFAAKQLVYENMKAVDGEKNKAIIVLGCVVQGDTPHFDYVCQGVTQGISSLNLVENGCPVIFGVLTTDNMQQALDRADGIHGNKGVEAAVTAIKMANIIW
jgi:6,7-dimethyl-8-ribityllumazine synthase